MSRKKDKDWEGFAVLKPGKELTPVPLMDCRHLFVPTNADYCLRNDKWLCRALLERGRCPA